MISLNLASPQEKKEHKILYFYATLKDLIFLMLIGMIVVTIFLIIARTILENNFTTTVNQNYLHGTIANYSKNEVRNFNANLTTISDIQKKFIPWSTIMIHINNLTNEGVTLLGITTIDTHTIQTKIRAKTREDLIVFQDSISKSAFFETVEIPLDVLFQKNDITYEFTLSLK